MHDSLDQRKASASYSKDIVRVTNESRIGQPHLGGRVSLFPHAPRNANPESPPSRRHRRPPAAAPVARQEARARRRITPEWSAWRDRLTRGRFAVTLGLCVALVAVSSTAIGLRHPGHGSSGRAESAKIVRGSGAADGYVSYAVRMRNYRSIARMSVGNAAVKLKASRSAPRTVAPSAPARTASPPAPRLAAAVASSSPRSAAPSSARAGTRSASKSMARVASTSAPSPLIRAAAAPSSTLFGDTPTGRGGVAAVDSAFGRGKVIRLFWSGAPRKSPVSDRKVVGSFSKMGSGTAAWARTMWRWTYDHEPDSKLRKGRLNLAAWRADMKSLVKLGIPGLSVILTADAFVSKRKNPNDYMIPGITHIGVDFDGISKSDGYHDYSRELAAVVAYTKAHGLSWGVGEFGANRASNDPSGAGRAAWLKTWAAKFKAAGAEYVTLWSRDSQARSGFTTPAEKAAVRSLLAR